MTQTYRLGIDAGGTFTDFVISDDSGEIRLYKAPSTPQDGTIAIRNGLDQISNDLDVPVEDIIANSDLCVNGTTVALNALIEKKGAKVGLLCTTGHEDSLEIRLGHKEEGFRYDTSYPQAQMLVERHLRRPIGGRMLSNGNEYEPLDQEAIKEAVHYFQEQGVESVAISFVWAAVNDQHEREAKAIVEQLMPGVPVCCGHEVFPQIREYTRTSTTVLNAYLTPIMDRYVARIDDLFLDLGAQRPIRYFQSNGGLALGQSMRTRAVAAINSGPASAPQAALYFGEPFGVDNCISVDMGGTSFDITLTRNGKTNVSKDIDFLRYRVGVPMIQVETLGAGGGSIAHISSQGILEVGPQSAGASPGPACYGKGGELPTVTDANLILGYLDPASVLGGTISLDREKARSAIEKHLAAPLGISVERAAYGISQIVNLNMVSGIRRVSTERGYDPRDFALVCAGGAAGMHITALAEEMGIDTVLVPKLASGLCAFGQIISDIRYNNLSTYLLQLRQGMNLEGLNAELARLDKLGVDRLKIDGFSVPDLKFERSAEMRYVGQIHECTVPVPNGELGAKELEELLLAFHNRHEELYTFSEEDSAVELVNVESTVIGKIPKLTRARVGIETADMESARKGSRSAVIDEAGQPIELPVYDGSILGADMEITGPAIIEEPSTTLVLRNGWTARLDSSACYKLSFAR